MVPEALAGPGTRGARLGPHGKRAARRAKGLEGALIDRQRHTIAAFDPTDPRVREIWVAGPAALVVAKLIKIGERFDAQDRVRDKDALDLFRLLQTVPTAQLATGLVLQGEDATASDVTSDALVVLNHLFTTADGAGIEMTIRAAGTPAASATIRASMVILANELLEAMNVGRS